MPRIADALTDCAVYIYRSVDDAKNGVRQGGSGFLVVMPMENDPTSAAHVYVVTNQHVVAKTQNPVIRLNRKSGGVDSIETKQSDWFPHPDGDDIAILPLRFDHQNIQWSAISVLAFLTQDLAYAEDVGIGDDTIMVGRFINHDGRQQNTPSVRFGNIAMMALEPITAPGSGIKQESFLVETRSLPGYSGSAVLIYSPGALHDMSMRRLGVEKSKINNVAVTDPAWLSLLQSFKIKGPYLLGIDWCHLNNYNPVVDKDGKPTEGLKVSENTGMAGVIPAWKILEVLNCDEVIAMRRANEKEIREAEQHVALDAAEGADGPSVFTKEDFEAALKKVSRRIQPSPPDEGKSGT